jgi:FkbM family methyltransferase
LRYLSHRGLVGDGLLHGIPIEGLHDIEVEGTMMKYWFRANDGLDQELFWYGFSRWEHATIKLYAQLAASARVTLDIGANSGIYSMIACAVNPSGRVIAFEPVPNTHALLKKNLEINSLTGRCLVHAIALGDSAGVTEITVPEDTSMATMAGGREGQRFEIRVEAGDSLVPPGTGVDLIKIDVEGFEAKALTGLSRVLAESKPAIIFEVWKSDVGAELEALLVPLGYTFYRIDDGEPEVVASLDPELAPEHNFLARVL